MWNSENFNFSKVLMNCNLKKSFIEIQETFLVLSTLTKNVVTSTSLESQFLIEKKHEFERKNVRKILTYRAIENLSRNSLKRALLKKTRNSKKTILHFVVNSRNVPITLFFVDADRAWKVS